MGLSSDVSACWCEGRAAVDPVPRDLPPQLTSFIGRERELVEARRLLGAHRLLTLTGAGGSGKIRFSIQLAGELAHLDAIKSIAGRRRDTVFLIRPDGYIAARGTSKRLPRVLNYLRQLYGSAIATDVP